ncbi:JAB domain-containing protein [Staphylococcus saprophyticus]|nr:JAB domain-containing protein [Staphylococcus saprophyticus]
MDSKKYIYKVLDVKQEYVETSYEVQKAVEPKEVARIINDVLDISNSTREHFIMLGLNTQLEVNVAYKVHIGALNAAIVHPRESFQVAILHNCTSVIFAHNHPSKSLKTSNEDIRTSKKLQLAGKILGIEMLDSLIVTNDGVTSLLEEGYLNELEVEDVINILQ